MIYIVSGFMRSGTSMMMAALMKGGMDAAYAKERDSLANSKSDEFYHPNKSGLYELHLEEYMQENFPLNYTNKLIKVLIWGLPRLTKHEYKIIIMLRNKEEIRQSYEAFFGRPIKHAFYPNFDKNMTNIINYIKDREDVKSVDLIQYRDIVNEPLTHFNLLKNNGWPIDVDLAAQVVDKDQYRFRLERLTVGI
jgi:hypothetical protein